MIEAAVISPDNQLVLSGSSDGTAKLWNINGRLLDTYRGGEQVNAVCFSNDNSKALISFRNDALFLQNLKTGETVYSKKIPNLQAAHFSKDDSQIVVVLSEEIVILDSSNGEPLFHTILFTGCSGIVEAACSNNKTRVFVYTGNGEITIVDPNTGVKNTPIPTFGVSPQSAMAVSPDGNKVVMIGKDANNVLGGHLIEIPGGQKHSFSVDDVCHENGMIAVRFLPDGSRFMAVFGISQKMISWNAADCSRIGNPVSQDTGLEDGFYTFSISDDASTLVGFGGNALDDVIRIMDTSSGLITQKISGATHTVYGSKMSADRKRLAVLIDLRSSRQNNVKVLDLNNELPVRNFNGGDGVFDISPDGSKIVFGGRGNGLRVYDIGSGKLFFEEFSPQDSAFPDVAFSPDSKMIATASRDKTARLFDSSKGDLYKSLSYKERIQSVVFSADGRKLLTVTTLPGIIQVLDVQTGIQELTLQHQYVGSAVFSSDIPSSKILSAGENGEAVLWDAQTGDIIRRFQVNSGNKDEKRIQFVAFAENDSKIITGHYKAGFKIWDASTGELLGTFDGHIYAGEVAVPRSFSITQRDTTKVISTRGDASVHIWDIHSRQILGTLYFLGEVDWAVLTPSGVFDASPGAMKMMHYAVGLEVVELDQLKERYWQPGLLSLLLNFEDGEIMDIERLEKVEMYPAVRLLEVKNDQLTVQLEARSGGIGKTSLYIGPCEVLADIDPERKPAFTVDLSRFNQYYVDGPNTIAIRVHNQAGWLKSPEYTRTYTFAGNGNRRATQALHALFVGTSRYSNPSLSLSYPDQDATYLSEAVDIVAKKLFDGGVHIKLLTTENPAAVSSKANIQKGFEELAAKAQPQDVLLVYFSGHGANYGTGEHGQFYYLTREVTSGNLDDAEVRNTKTISSEELTTWINKIPARKQVLIFDTCHSGKLLDALKSKSALDTTRERALERMKDRTGTYVLAGSSADKVSYEASNYGHGLLTYTLLQGMKGFFVKWEPKDGKPTVDVSTLLMSTRERVPDLAAELNVTQVPVLRVPQHGESFAIGISDKEEQEQIKLVSPVPVFVRSNFMNEDSYFDDIDLSEAMDQHIAEAFSKGRGARALFVSIKRFPNAYTVRGIYKKTPGGYEVKGKIYKDNANTDCMGDFHLKGKGVEDLVPRIGFEAERFVLDVDDLTPKEREDLAAKTLSALQEIETAKGPESKLVGYDALFLGEPVPLPILTEVQKKDTARLLNDGDKYVLDYQYYSVVQSKSRRFPYFAACNLNGAEFVQCARKGTFILDNRIAPEHQWGDELYKYKYKEDEKETRERKDKETGAITRVEVPVSHRFTNFLDRGHMTKREDTQWVEGAGNNPKHPSAAIAERGARLTFFFTNAVPQVGRFNRGAWKKLEDFIMEEAADRKKGDGAKYRVCIFTGPVLDQKDPEVTIEIEANNTTTPAQVKIPVLFWKIVYFKKGNQLYSVGFVMGQEDLFRGTYKDLTGLEAKGAGSEFILKDTELEVAQVSISYIEQLTGMKFHPAVDPHKDKPASPIIYQMHPAAKGAGAEGGGPTYSMQGLNLG